MGQLFGGLILLIGISQAIPLVALLRGLAAGDPLVVKDLSLRIAASGGPLLLGGVLVFGFGALRSWLADLAQRKAEFPDQPWMWRADWADKHIRLSNRAATITLLIAWGFFFTVALPMGLVGAAIKNANVIYGFLGAFALILLAFTRMMWVNRRWNQSELRLTSVPGVVGGPISGAIILQDVFPAGSVFKVTLKCEETTTRSSGPDNSTSTTTTVLWQNQKMLDSTLNTGIPSQTGLPVYFAIPFDSEPTSVDSPVQSRGWKRGTVRSRINWWVEVALRDDPLMRSARFEVPVFVTPDSSPGYVEQEERLAEFLEQPDALAVLEKQSFERSETSAGVQLRFSMFNGTTFLALVMTLILFSLITAAAFLWARPWPLPWFLGLIPGVLSVMLLVGIVMMLTWSSSILIGRDEIHIQAGYLGFRKRISFPRKQPPRTRVEQEIERAAHPVFGIYVSDADEKRVPLFRHIESRQDAEAVRSWLAEQWRDRA